MYGAGSGSSSVAESAVLAFDSPWYQSTPSTGSSPSAASAPSQIVSGAKGCGTASRASRGVMNRA